MNKIKTKYDNLYLDILRIGLSSLGTGLSYNKLKSLLESKGYDFTNDCIEIAVKQWFYDSFHHRGADDLPYRNMDDLKNHLDCNFVMKGESCITFINQKTAHRNLVIAILAFVISIFALAYAIYTT